MPKVSVVVPAYNALAFLSQTLDSIKAQTFEDFEVLVIDDGSSDGIEGWFSEHIQDSRFSLISQPNQGLSAARNKGISLAEGEYIAFLDADDTWAADKLEKQVSVLDNSPRVGLVHTWYAMIDMDGVMTGAVFRGKTLENPYEKLLVQNFIGVASVMARRECFERVGGFNCELKAVEDWEMWIRLSSVYKIACIPEILMFYRQVPTSLSKNCQKMEDAFAWVIESSFEKAPNELRHLKASSYGYSNLCLGWKALQADSADFRLASRYHLRALRASPALIRDRESLRLSVAIAMMALLRGDRYKATLQWLNRPRR